MHALNEERMIGAVVTEGDCREMTIKAYSILALASMESFHDYCMSNGDRISEIRYHPRWECLVKELCTPNIREPIPVYRLVSDQLMSEDDIHLTYKQVY